MILSISFTSISVFPNLQPHSGQRLFTKCIELSQITTSFAALKCNSVADDSSDRCVCAGNSGSMNMKSVMPGMVDEKVEQLQNEEVNRALLSEKHLSIIQQQEAEAKLARDYINHFPSKASEIADCQKEVLEAKATMEEEAERCLLTSSIGNRDYYSVTKMKGEVGVINRDAEKMESVKAASISAIVGTLAALPLALTRTTTTTSSYSHLILPLTITSFSCALFGATFLYAVRRRDLDNVHLKSGTCAAFACVKGLGELGEGPPLELEMGSLQQHASAGAFYVTENLVPFFFAAVALDLCIKMKFLSPIPSD